MWSNMMTGDAEFIESVDHPSFGLHLDQMNLVSQDNYHNTTELINRTFDLLGRHAVSVHLKDITCDFKHMFLKYDEVLICDGVMYYNTYLNRRVTLGEDTPCYCEYLSDESDYLVNFSRLHALAKNAGVVVFNRRAAAAGSPKRMQLPGNHAAVNMKGSCGDIRCVVAHQKCDSRGNFVGSSQTAHNRTAHVDLLLPIIAPGLRNGAGTIDSGAINQPVKRNRAFGNSPA